MKIFLSLKCQTSPLAGRQPTPVSHHGGRDDPVKEGFDSFSFCSQPSGYDDVHISLSRHSHLPQVLGNSHPWSWKVKQIFPTQVAPGQAKAKLSSPSKHDTGDF